MSVSAQIVSLLPVTDPHCMRYGDHDLTDESIFKKCGVVVFVVDAQVHLCIFAAFFNKPYS